MKNYSEIAKELIEHAKFIQLLERAHSNDLAEYLEQKGFRVLADKQKQLINNLSAPYPELLEAELEGGQLRLNDLIGLFHQVVELFSEVGEALEGLEPSELADFLKPSEEFSRFLNILLVFQLSLEAFLAPGDQEVEYVDVDGNPIDPTELDPDSIEFTDEDGNPVDAQGNPLSLSESNMLGLDTTLNENTFLPEAVKILHREDYQVLFTHVCECLNATESEFIKLELNKLRAIALGGLGRHPEARVLLLELLERAPSDGYVLANYITSCFACGDGKSACGGIEIYYQGLDGASRGAVLESVAEALRIGEIRIEDAPAVILEDLRGFLGTGKA